MPTMIPPGTQADIDTAHGHYIRAISRRAALADALLLPDGSVSNDEQAHEDLENAGGEVRHAAEHLLTTLGYQPAF